MIIARKFWNMLLPAQRRVAMRLLFLLLVGMLLEMLSIGLIFPALALMTHGDFQMRFPAFANALAAFGLHATEHLIVLGMICLVVAYVIKTLFLGLSAWQQSCFVFGLQASLSDRLFRGYLHREYTFHLQRNSAQLIGNIVNETNQFTGSLISGLILTAEMLNVLGICILLVSIEPLGSIVIVAIVGAAGGGFYWLTRSRLVQWGTARQFHEGMRIQHLQQGLGGVKDVKLLGRESEFLSQYAIHNVGVAKMQRRQNILQQLPRLWLEFLTVVGLAIYVFASVVQGRSTESLIPSLGLFAAAAFRLIPSANRVLGSMQNVRYMLPVVDALHAELKSFQNAQVVKSGQPICFRQVLALEKICYTYSTASESILHDVSLTVECGAAIGFIGGSGAGKSTLVDLILGLLTPTSGVVRVDGIDIQTNLRSWQDQIGYVPQSIFLTDDTLRRNVAFGVTESQIDDAFVWDAICAAQLEEFVSGLPEGINTMVGERGVRISGGQRQRIGIARALYCGPTVLILDEATSSLDRNTESGVLEAVRALKGKKTVLIVAHRLSTIAHCDRVYRIEQGRMIEDFRGGQVFPPDILSVPGEAIL